MRYLNETNLQDIAIGAAVLGTGGGGNPYIGYLIGREAIRQLVQHVKTRPNASELLTSVVQAEGGPEGFYKSLGFTFTGEYEDGEALMRLEL